MEIFAISERRACKLLEQPRSTQRLPVSEPSPLEKVLRERLRALAAKHPRYGYRRLHPILRREGFQVNAKRVGRLCLSEGLRVVVRKRKRRRNGDSTNPGERQVAVRPNHVWALDFQFDQTSDYRTLKFLNITDEFTKTALAIEVERSMTGDDIVNVLERLIAIHGAPECVRMDNGTEMTSNAIMDWCEFSPANISYIDPGAPWQNAYVESFNGKLRDELLAVEIFTTLLEAKIMSEDFRQNYNKYRPHSSLNYMTPNEFTLNWHHTNQGLIKTLAQ